jgi:hypothetical protein
MRAPSPARQRGANQQSQASESARVSIAIADYERRANYRRTGASPLTGSETSSNRAWRLAVSHLRKR